MTRTRYRLVAFTLMALALVALVVGCKGATPSVIAIWPRADAERAVPKPPEPPRWPLTGMPAPSADILTRRVVSVKIENSSDSRPQSNLQLADVVYESVTEGGITRFNAIFHSQAPPVVGPVRSARLSDIYIVPQYQALFAFSGASSSVNGRVNAAGIDNLSEDAGIVAPFTRSSSRPRPHNLYVDIEKVRAEGERRKMDVTAEIRPFEFDRRARETTPSVTEITIPFSQTNTVAWTYNAEDDVYMRVNNGKKFLDAETDTQISARNVVVMWAKHQVASRDKVGSTTYEIVLDGQGRAVVFRGGQRFECTWKAKKGAPPSFEAEDGTTVKLLPGNTWMQVINTSVNIKLK